MTCERPPVPHADNPITGHPVRLERGGRHPFARERLHRVAPQSCDMERHPIIRMPQPSPCDKVATGEDNRDAVTLRARRHLKGSNYKEHEMPAPGTNVDKYIACAALVPDCPSRRRPRRRKNSWRW